MNTSRWRFFYDLAAAQFAVVYATSRSLSMEEKEMAAKRMAAEACRFADAMAKVDAAASQSTPPVTRAKPPVCDGSGSFYGGQTCPGCENCNPA